MQHFTKILLLKKELMWKMDILVHRRKEIKCFNDYDLKTFEKKFPKKQEKVGPLLCRLNNL